MNTKRKGQAAIEFLVTYGWAIMAAMLVIGALSYFGMTNPATNLPDKCLFSNVFECKDYYLNGTVLQLQLINTAGESIYGVPSITAKLTDTEAACVISGLPTLLEPEEQLNITCSTLPETYDKKEKIKLKLTISYAKNPSSTYTHVSLGELYTTVQ